MLRYSIRGFLKLAYRGLPSPLQRLAVAAYISNKRRRLTKLTTPSTLIFFVTTRCNARCAHCFYWNELNRPTEDLSLDEIEKISASLSSPVYLSLTGGEPFLRDDLAQIAEVFVRRNGCRNIGIASNGFLSDRILEQCESILRINGLETLSVQISLDGLPKTHDLIRGVQGAYVNAMRTLKTLSLLSSKDKRFSVAASMTIQQKNLGEAEELATEMQQLGIPAKFALVRGKNSGTYGLPAKASSEIDPKETDSVVHDLSALDQLFNRLQEQNNSTINKFWSLRQQEKIRLSLAMMREKKRQLPCYAGQVDGVLYANGDVALCELTKPVGNIRQYGGDFQAVWNSPEADRMRTMIRNCFCIHGCNLTTSMMFDPNVVHEVLSKNEYQEGERVRD